MPPLTHYCPLLHSFSSLSSWSFFLPFQILLFLCIFFLLFPLFFLFLSSFSSLPYSLIFSHPSNVLSFLPSLPLLSCSFSFFFMSSYSLPSSSSLYPFLFFSFFVFLSIPPIHLLSHIHRPLFPSFSSLTSLFFSLLFHIFLFLSIFFVSLISWFSFFLFLFFDLLLCPHYLYLLVFLLPSPPIFSHMSSFFSYVSITTFFTVPSPFLPFLHRSYNHPISHSARHNLLPIFLHFPLLCLSSPCSISSVPFSFPLSSPLPFIFPILFLSFYPLFCFLSSISLFRLRSVSPVPSFFPSYPSSLHLPYTILFPLKFSPFHSYLTCFLSSACVLSLPFILPLLPIPPIPFCLPINLFLLPPIFLDTDLSVSSLSPACSVSLVHS